MATTYTVMEELWTCEKKCRGCLEAKGLCAFRKVYIHDAWKLMPVNYTVHYIDVSSDENAPFKI